MAALQLQRGERGCGPDGDVVIIEGDVGWRLNRSTGRIEPTDPDDAQGALPLCLTTTGGA
jgi:hypothetical protein